MRSTFESSQQETNLELPQAWPPIETDIAKVDEYEKKLAETLTQLGWEEWDILDVTLVFREWLLNAIIHGNMGLFRQPEEEENIWLARIQAARDLAEVKAKHIRVEIKATSRRLEVFIQDEGKNTKPFWPEDGKYKNHEVDMTMYSGRGDLIARAFTTEFKFEKNSIGVKVAFIRDLDIPLPERK